jgi:hypothetical protein
MIARVSPSASILSIIRADLTMKNVHHRIRDPTSGRSVS